jgi:hypothetical protein
MATVRDFPPCLVTHKKLITGGAQHLRLPGIAGFVEDIASPQDWIACVRHQLEERIHHAGT